MLTNKKLFKPKHFVFKLFVSTYATSSQRAITNLTNLFETNLKGRYDLQIIDVRQEPELALQENIVALPLLIKIVPRPCRRLVGDMSNELKVLAGLNLSSI